MGLKGIIAVGGLSGLYKIISQTKTGFIVESLADQKKSIVHSTQKVIALNDISVYTTSEEKPLKDVLLLMKEKESVSVNPKSEPEDLKKYFRTIVPDFDEQRVYISDIKKIISWFHLLKDILDQKDNEPEVKMPEKPEVAKSGDASGEEKPE